MVTLSRALKGGVPGFQDPNFNTGEIPISNVSGRENYFRRAGQNVRQAFSALPDILRSLPDMSGIFRDH